MAITAINITWEEIRFLIRELKTWAHPQAESLLQKALEAQKELASFDGKEIPKE